MSPTAETTFSSLVHAWDAWAFTGVLVIALPCFAYFCLFKGAKGHGYFSKISKSESYSWITATLWLMVLLLALLAHRHGLSMEDLGEHSLQPVRAIVVTAAVLLLLSLMSFFDLQRHIRMPRDQLEGRLSGIKHFFPSGLYETIAFVVMAISAGVCEELLFRSWLLNLIGAATGSVWIGLFVSSFAFGFAHAYQGPQGIVSTGVVGLVLGLLFIWLGSLVPVQIVHAWINLSSGLMCAYLMTRLNKGTHVETSPAPDAERA